MTTQVITLVGDAAPDGNGRFKGVGQPVLNDAGQVAFSASLFDSSEPFGGGIFRGDGTTLTQIARGGQAAPDGNGILSPSSENFVLNGAGQVAFNGALTRTSGGSSDNTSIFRSDGGVPIQLVREGQAAPDANGSFSQFASFALNDRGHVAFYALLTDTHSGMNDNVGVFIGTGSDLTQIAREGQAAPGANGRFSSFSSPALNDAGQLAFLASMTVQSAGLMTIPVSY